MQTVYSPITGPVEQVCTDETGKVGLRTERPVIDTEDEERRDGALALSDARIDADCIVDGCPCSEEQRRGDLEDSAFEG